MNTSGPWLCDVCWAKKMRAEAATKPAPFRVLIEAVVRTLEQHNDEQKQKAGTDND